MAQSMMIGTVYVGTGTQLPSISCIQSHESTLVGDFRGAGSRLCRLRCPRILVKSQSLEPACFACTVRNLNLLLYYVLPMNSPLVDRSPVPGPSPIPEIRIRLRRAASSATASRVPSESAFTNHRACHGPGNVCKSWNAAILSGSDRDITKSGRRPSTVTL